MFSESTGERADCFSNSVTLSESACRPFLANVEINNPELPSYGIEP